MKLPNPIGQKAAVGYLGVVKLATSRKETAEAAIGGVFLKTLQNSLENTCAGISFLCNKVACWRPVTFKKVTPTQMFSEEYCEIC